MTGNDLETSIVPLSVLFCIIEKNTFSECKGKQFMPKIINRTIFFVIVLLLTLPGVLHYFYLMQIHVSQDNKHELFAYIYV